MKYTSIVLFVSDIHRSDTFYKTILDQETEYDFGTNIGYNSGISLWQLSPDHEITIHEDTDTKSVRTELYFEMEDLLPLRQKLLQNHVVLLHDIKTESWGQQTIRFFDPDHHLIEVGEPIKVFVKRIYNETGSVDKTSEMTGINPKMIRELTLGGFKPSKG